MEIRFVPAGRSAPVRPRCATFWPAMASDEKKTDADVDYAFREWCALVGVSPLPSGTAGGFQLASDAEGRVHIDQIVPESGERRALTPAMTRGQFCDAVRFLHESFNVKTVQVARTLAKRKRPRP